MPLFVHMWTSGDKRCELRLAMFALLLHVVPLSIVLSPPDDKGLTHLFCHQAPGL